MPDVDDARSVPLPVLHHRVVVDLQGEAECMTSEKGISLAERK